MLAVIQTGSKQYKVSPGSRVKIEKIEGKEGKKVVFNNVLLREKGKKLDIGTPKVRGAKVEGVITKQGRRKKVTILKFKAKKRQKKVKGHCQPYTEVEIKNIIS